MRSENNALIIQSLFSLLLGALVFLFFFGFSTINPLNTEFISCLQNDLTLNYIGWHFYRNADWTFPFGIYNSLSYPDYLSILQTDSIPLFAMFFKIFKNFLPEDFQYFGLFGLMCFMLQSFFGMLIVRYFTSRNIFGDIVALMSGVLLCFSVFIIVISYVHHSSIAHWIILASYIPFLYKNFFSKKKSIFYFLFLGFCAAGINIYLLLFSGIILFFYFAYNLFQKKYTLVTIMQFMSFLFASVFMLYISGFFVGDFIYIDNEMLDLSLNLNAFFNPIFNQVSLFLTPLSLFHHSQAIIPAYLGLGTILLILLSTILFIVNVKKYIYILKSGLFYLVLILFLTSIFLAVSPRITFGNTIIFEYNLPGSIMDIWSIFRVTGRFIYLSYYLFILISIIFLSRKFQAINLSIILFFVIVMQFFEFLPLRMIKNNEIKQNHLSFHSNNITYYLNKIDSKIEILNIQALMYLNNSFEMSKKIFIIAHWAQKNNIKLTDYYFARALKNREYKYNKHINNANEKSLFILDEKFLKPYATCFLDKSDLNFYYIKEVEMIVISLAKISGLNQFKVSPEFIKEMYERE